MKQNGLGIASLILGILGILSSCIVIGIIPSIVSLFLGAVAIGQTDGTSKRCAIGGTICSVIGILLFSVFLVLWISD